MNFCTIITPDYIHYALSLRESLLQFNNQTELYIFVSQFSEGLKERIEDQFKNTYVLYPYEICNEGIGKAIFDKYADTFMDGFRWSIKPVLLRYLLQNKGVEKIIYTDCDILFYSDYSFLFNELNANNVLLTPHWRTSDPLLDETHFIAMYTSGIYNAGFIGVNLKAIEAMEWWAKANLFICEIDASKGQFVDQTHLNLLPVYFDDVKILKHRGCNVAGWNILECKRTVGSDGTVLINDTWPIVFVHFSNHTISSINEGEDELLRPHLNLYQNRIEDFAKVMGMNSLSKVNESKTEPKPMGSIANLLNRLISKSNR